MKSAFKNFLSAKSQETLRMKASYFCFLSGLLIQFIIIICSFFWSPEQFSLPKVYPGIFIFVTVLTLVPILGYIVFINFLFMFISTFKGPHLLIHPWFYYIFGMLVFNIGMILFRMAAGNAASQKTE